MLYFVVTPHDSVSDPVSLASLYLEKWNFSDADIGKGAEDPLRGSS